NLVSKLSKYRRIRPYRSTADGEFLTYDISTKSDVSVHRRRRSADGVDEVDMSSSYHFVVESVDGDDLLLNLDRVTDLFSPNFVVEKFTDDGESIVESPDTSCFFQGHVGNLPDTTVAISTCEGLSGVISVGDDEYMIEPVDMDQPASITNTSFHGNHIIYRTTDHEGHEDAVDLLRPIDLTSDGDTSSSDDDVTSRARRAPRRIATDRMHYVQTMLVADKSVQDFHGDSVELYMATLMNIVNKIYAHHTLGLNIQFVIVKIALLTESLSNSIILDGSTRIAQSLRNANEWAASQNRPVDNSKHFDMSIFLTKISFGASGYANVGEICRQSLSASLVLDREGLKSAFVVAHEAAHLMGVHHDNDDKSCRNDADSSAVMAAYVTSNFHNFYWSPCSRGQLFKKMRNGDLGCLTDTPGNVNSETTYPASHQVSTSNVALSLDHRLRLVKYEANRDLCAILYCATEPNGDQCTAVSRTSRALEGTPCGNRQFCIQGECQVRRNFEAVDTIYEWHSSEWSPCSVTCGAVGVKTRELTCREVVYDKSGRLEEIRDPVEKSLCHPDLKPAKKTECPTRDCVADWVTDSWSECSVTCGEGTMTREVSCDIPRRSDLQFRCWGSKPAKSKSCRLEDCPDTGECTPRGGAICKAKFYERYCRIPGYEEECCYTCAQQKERIDSWRGKRTKN
ncbi:putative A disintegrin and metalloproteinase with thrombospondin motifs 3 isoform X1, partial [Apostichopus japonicus]